MTLQNNVSTSIRKFNFCYNLAKATFVSLSIPKRRRIVRLWMLSRPFFRSCRPNDLPHTLLVMHFVRKIGKKEGGDLNILIPAAMIHDLGWSRVPTELHHVPGKNEEGLRQHIRHGIEIAEEILPKAGFTQTEIDKIKDLIREHKFVKPEKSDQKIFIDADRLSKIPCSQFWNMARTYAQVSPDENLAFLRRKPFYTATAKRLAERGYPMREREISLSRCSKRIEQFMLNLY